MGQVEAALGDVGQQPQTRQVPPVAQQGAGPLKVGQRVADGFQPGLDCPVGAGEGGVDELLVEGLPSDAVVSAPTVSRPPYVGPQTLFVQGLEGWIGDARVEPFNRTLNLSGFDSLAMGATSGSDAPYAWQSLHVGEPMPTLPEWLH